MGIINKLGTQVRLADGREATVVFNSLAGVGVKLGLHNPPPEAFAGTSGNTIKANVPADWPWEPDCMLRDLSLVEVLGMPCVGDPGTVEILRVGLGDEQ